MGSEQVKLETSGQTVAYLRSLAQGGKSGELLLQYGDVQGKVYLESGAIIWAFASGQTESFQSLLVRSGRVSKEALIEGIRLSRESGKRLLDDILITLGISDQSERSQIIQRHTLSAIQTILSWQNSIAYFAEKKFDNVSLSFPLETFIPKQTSGAAPAAAAKKEVLRISSLKEVLNLIQKDVPNSICIVVIDGKTGLPLDGISNVDTLDVEAASAYFQQVIHSAQDAQLALGSSNQPAEIIINTGEELIFIRLLSQESHAILFILNREGNLSTARAALKNYLQPLRVFLS